MSYYYEENSSEYFATWNKKNGVWAVKLVTTSTLIFKCSEKKRAHRFARTYRIEDDIIAHNIPCENCLMRDWYVGRLRESQHNLSERKLWISPRKFTYNQPWLFRSKSSLRCVEKETYLDTVRRRACFFAQTTGYQPLEHRAPEVNIHSRRPKRPFERFPRLRLAMVYLEVIVRSDAPADCRALERHRTTAILAERCRTLSKSGEQRTRRRDDGEWREWTRTSELRGESGCASLCPCFFRWFYDSLRRNIARFVAALKYY